MSFRCAKCGHSASGVPSHCPRCEASVEPAPLAELRPEAEPPLPAAHEALRGRTPPLGAVTRGDPTPSRRKDPTPLGHSLPADDMTPERITGAAAWLDGSAHAAELAPAASRTRAERVGAMRRQETAYDAVPEPVSDAPSNDQERVTTLHSRTLRTSGALSPIPDPPGEVPSLLERRGLRRAFVAILLCVAGGAAVGWLLSTPEPPTPDEIRARSVKPR